MKKKIKTERKYQLLNELLIIDGQPGCGKTLFSAIVSAFSRVELLQFSTIAENICALNYLEKIEYEDALTFLKIEFDQRIYETMMSRNLNFRIKDLSSVFNN